MLLRDATATLSTARRDMAQGIATKPGYWSARASLTPTATLWSPLPGQEGKVATIQAYIDPLRRPMLIAGDSSSDWPMLSHSRRVRLWIDHDAASTERLQAMRMRMRMRMRRGGDGARRWVEVAWGRLERSE